MLRMIKRVTPDRLKVRVKQLLEELDLQSMHISEQFTRVPREYEGFIFPPPKLRQRVHGKKDRESFLENARDNAQTIVGILEKHKVVLGDLERVYDWGCGPGKILQALQLFHILANGERRRPELWGSDIDGEAIQWASRKLYKVKFFQNGTMPPSPFEDRFFDLVYGISVFTHLDEIHQDAWLHELYRITKPGAFVLLSFHGAHAASLSVSADSDDHRILQAKGILYRSSIKLRYGLPECYGTTYHTRDYLFEKFGEVFEVVEFVERGVRRFQDLLLLKKPSAR